MAFNVNNCYGGGNSEWGKTRPVIVTFLLRKKWENFKEKSIEFSGEILPFLSCENTLYSYHRCLSMKKSKNENFNKESFRATVHEFVQKRVLTSIENPTDSKQANPRLRCHPEVASDQTKSNTHGVFPDQNYRVWDLVRAHNSMIRGQFGLGMVWSEVTSVWGWYDQRSLRSGDYLLLLLLLVSTPFTNSKMHSGLKQIGFKSFTEAKFSGDWLQRGW